MHPIDSWSLFNGTKKPIGFSNGNHQFSLLSRTRQLELLKSRNSSQQQSSRYKVSHSEVILYIRKESVVSFLTGTLYDTFSLPFPHLSISKKLKQLFWTNSKKRKANPMKHMTNPITLPLSHHYLSTSKIHFVEYIETTGRGQDETPFPVRG